ncbi:hypothetical protein A2630_00365 [Candidatus Woesebacteria bacterium RIFCSPHIGHO2_01_FULL_44_10]|uniref:Cytidyltransferase-like domain-containing protein n=1 Tax=Candidatus Woesebacteria bacterium RIFCSPLOWO2_01_FULL_44_14 TaxID=1802525 RepID=A0A1F8C387_9BACT|nr:MAG: hypothetical protein A2630_00365 [Candidatus Woesebacteria bacterium RIFCSPHIGHO2_01_FULL_44_10]OGM53738.1 MAG: hypothetical protein A3F62_03680 [Candidatus Woesebacteria bacterium RIFCSPHIGHO2_12_FULL_44_11]OGM70085.1 MAG: hypothetical protein A2975_03345 [Candidatus Woesebacteria bacterium RIFCSPLOWO2_01_FULL_44_14]
MGKIKKLDEVAKIVKSLRQEGQKVGLITGCFDILHIGHIELFRFAKKHVDVLVVGLENDQSIKITKGKNRPIHKLSQRAETLSDLSTIDFIFPIETIIRFNNPDTAGGEYRKIYKKIRPNFIISNDKADKYWRQKQSDAAGVGAKLILDEKRKTSSTTRIAQKLKIEN